MKVSESTHNALLKEMAGSQVDRKYLSDWVLNAMGLPDEKANMFKIVEAMEKRPDMQHPPDFHSLSKEDMMIDRAQKFNKFHKEFDMNKELNSLRQYYFYSVHLPLTIHYAQFVPTVKALASDEQQAKWMPMIEKLSMMGAYAQTELGHGSDIRNLKTTAIFDKKNDCFVLNSPSVDSVKFWPGELGLFGNYALVFAQLIIDGDNYGLNCFMVRLKDEQHRNLPGIETGDIGAKFGFLGKDNGYLKLTNLKVPREDMLSRYAHVSKEGDFEILGDPRAMYAGMMEVRSLLSRFTWNSFSMALVIATRYSVFRKQFKDGSGKETSVLNYQLQQDKLITQWARLFAIIGSAHSIKALVDLNAQKITKHSDFTKLKETHISLAGFKFYFTDMIFRGIEKCRLACGGHGFHHFSQLPSLRQESTANITLEGENTVMTLQVARYLVKQMAKAKKGSLKKDKEFMQQMDYIINFNQYLKRFVKVESQKQLLNLEIVQDLLTIRACNVLSLATEQYETLVAQGVGKKRAWDIRTTLQAAEAAKCHLALWTFRCFSTFLTQFYSQATKQENHKTLTNLCLLFGIDSLLDHSAGLVEVESVDPSVLKYLEEAKEYLLDKLRADVVSIAESFEYNEIILKFSPLGRQDGRVYENLLDMARNIDFNQQTALSKGVQSILSLKETTQKRKAKARL